jgi:hypothetical protein
VARGRVDEQLALVGGDRAPVERELDHRVIVLRP